MNDAPEILTFHDDEGNPCDFEYIGTVEHEGSYYLLLHPTDSETTNEEDLEVMILKLMKDEKGQDSFLTVEDPELFDKLIDLYNAMDELDTMDLASVLGESEEGQDNENL